MTSFLRSDKDFSRTILSLRTLEIIDKDIFSPSRTVNVASSKRGFLACTFSFHFLVVSKAFRDQYLIHHIGIPPGFHAHSCKICFSFFRNLPIPLQSDPRDGISACIDQVHSVYWMSISAISWISDSGIPAQTVSIYSTPHYCTIVFSHHTQN